VSRAVVAVALVVVSSALSSSILDAQTFSQRGFVEGRAFEFPETTPTDTTRTVGDFLFREDVVVKPARWIQFAGGLDLRGNSHDQVEDTWRVDFKDRTVLRPRVAVRRLGATLFAKGFTLDLGKQFIRWARADILNPADRFAPRDFLNVIDTDFLPVLGARASLQVGSETFEGVWIPRFTPSRLPLFDQRWTVLPPAAAGLSLVDLGSDIPRGPQEGVRWRHAGARFESSLSYFNGFNHLPDIVVETPSPGVLALTRVYPALRTYGGDMAVPTGWLTLKAEAAYFTSPTSQSDEYVLYVIEAERQTGEWLLDGGYAGEVVTTSVTAVNRFSFAAERGMARSIIGRASYTVDPRRTVAVEAAVRRNGDGFYVKGEYSQVWGQHWRVTATGVGINGVDSDFLGQYRRNSHVSIALRFSF
jgi:hypothetical protein